MQHRTLADSRQAPRANVLAGSRQSVHKPGFRCVCRRAQHAESGILRPRRASRGNLDRSRSTGRDGDLMQRGRGNSQFGGDRESHRNAQGGKDRRPWNILLLRRLDDHKHHKAGRRSSIDQSALCFSSLVTNLPTLPTFLFLLFLLSEKNEYSR